MTEPAGAATSFADEEDDMALAPEKVESPSSDPIEEAPDAVWYVRPPSGGQYGPARGEVMRRWLSEGRVSADSMVWREGWSDWQTAGPLFPSLQAAHTTTLTAPKTPHVSTAPSLLASSPAHAAAPESRTQTTASTRRAASKRNKSLVPVVILGLLIVVLLVVTVIVLTRT